MSKEQLTAVFSCVFLVSVFISSVSQILLKKSADKTYDSKLKEYLLAVEHNARTQLAEKK